MKVKFLGTIAAEGGPALFCNCEFCKEAKKRGGKNIRSRSQLLVNEDVLVDFPADTYMHKTLHNLDLSKVRYLLITHSHGDHFYPNDLCLHGAHCGYDMVEPVMDIYCNREVRNRFIREAGYKVMPEVEETMRWHIVSEFQKLDTERYEIWTLKAKHMKTEDPVFYLIKQGDKAFMQCYDTGVLWEENYEFLSSLGVKIDAICLDCTIGDPKSSYFGHMNLKECLDTVERMRKSNFVKPNTRFILTHFSHNGLILHEEYEELCAPYNVEIAYDGMEIEF